MIDIWLNIYRGRKGEKELRSKNTEGKPTLEEKEEVKGKENMKKA